MKLVIEMANIVLTYDIIFLNAPEFDGPYYLRAVRKKFAFENFQSTESKFVVYENWCNTSSKDWPKDQLVCLDNLISDLDMLIPNMRDQIMTTRFCHPKRFKPKMGLMVG